MVVALSPGATETTGGSPGSVAFTVLVPLHFEQLLKCVAWFHSSLPPIASDSYPQVQGPRRREGKSDDDAH